jgi:excisionase family DNA binding protein
MESKITCGVAEAAVSLGICERNLREIIAQGKIPVCRIGTRVLLRRSDLEAYAAAHVGPWAPAAVGRGAHRAAV